ncbi:MAG TPA: pentapeptide repeat-containing protein [Candidatus Babeliales bacterium]|nr:pentapeptide repeat-containing protein [Candidatus Babeliales bacterium]
MTGSSENTTNMVKISAIYASFNGARLGLLLNLSNANLKGADFRNVKIWNGIYWSSANKEDVRFSETE